MCAAELVGSPRRVGNCSDGTATRTSAERGTRERILEIAEATLAECGYHGMRLQCIAERVGVQKASLFHYFSSKEDLYRAVLDSRLDETEQVIRSVVDAEGSPVGKLRQLLEAYVDMVAGSPKRTNILLRQSLGDAPSTCRQPPDTERLLSLVAAFVSDGQRANLFAPVDPITLVLGVVGMVAFLFTSGTVLDPVWGFHARNPAFVDHIKHHVVEVMQRTLRIED